MSKDNVVVKINLNENKCYIEVTGTMYELPISGRDRYQYKYAEHYNLQNIAKIKTDLNSKRKKITFLNSTRGLNNVDPMVYDALGFVDTMLEEDKQSKYAEIAMKSFDKSKSKEECRKERKKLLDNLGISIIYEDTPEKKSKSKIDFISKLNGINFKRKYEELFGIDVNEIEEKSNDDVKEPFEVLTITNIEELLNPEKGGEKKDSAGTIDEKMKTTSAKGKNDRNNKKTKAKAKSKARPGESKSNEMRRMREERKKELIALGIENSKRKEEKQEAEQKAKKEAEQEAKKRSRPSLLLSSHAMTSRSRARVPSP